MDTQDSNLTGSPAQPEPAQITQPVPPVQTTKLSLTDMQSKLIVQGVTLASAAMAIKSGSNLTPEQQGAIIKTALVVPAVLEGVYHLIQGVKHFILRK